VDLKTKNSIARSADVLVRVVVTNLSRLHPSSRLPSTHRVHSLQCSHVPNYTRHFHTADGNLWFGSGIEYFHELSHPYLTLTLYGNIKTVIQQYSDWYIGR